MVKTVHDRAQFDLNCDEIQVQKLGYETYGVTGCGTRASYVVVEASADTPASTTARSS